MDDEREEELNTLSSIYPEIIVDAHNPNKFTLSIPVALTEPINATFTGQYYDAATAQLDSQDTIRQIRHLPPLTLTVTLPDRYPNDIFPLVQIDVNPAWLDFGKLKELEKQCQKLWEEYGRCQILFTYIGYVQEAAERMFDLGNQVTISASLKDALVKYDADREQEIFHSGSYECGVCLEPKRGTACWRMRSCGHVFCRPCLQDFYNSAITEGDVGSITCLDPTCGKTKPGVPVKRKHLHPSELLHIGISEPQARRYVELRRKKKLESDKATIYCPRTWCQSAARSTKHAPIPEDLKDYVDSDDADSLPDAPPAYSKNTPEKSLPAPADRLAICSNPKCSFAFCRVCYAGWHGEFARCWPRNPTELSEEEKASYDYIRSHTSPCPTCSSPTQKTMGCNHMKCFQCNTHFCYLCSSWLAPDNPYEHFNNRGKECYMRLWELEEGDEGQGGQFVGARRWEAEAAAIAAEDSEEEEEEEQAIRALVVAQQNDPEVEAERRLRNGNAAAPPRPRPLNNHGRPRFPPPGPIDAMHQLALDLQNVLDEDGSDEEPGPVAPNVPLVGGNGRGGNRARQRAAEALADVRARYPPAVARPPGQGNRGHGFPRAFNRPARNAARARVVGDQEGLDDARWLPAVLDMEAEERRILEEAEMHHLVR